VPNSARKIWNLSAADKWLHCLALLSLTSASLALLVLPAHRLASPSLKPHGQVEHASLAVLNQSVHIGQTVERIARRCFWKPVCLPQAIATAWLLKRRGISFEVLLGVKDAFPTLEAHAWVEVGNTIIVGGDNRHEYRLIGPLSQAESTANTGRQT
jgi:hypothetical protein